MSCPHTKFSSLIKMMGMWVISSMLARNFQLLGYAFIIMIFSLSYTRFSQFFYFAMASLGTWWNIALISLLIMLWFHWRHHDSFDAPLAHALSFLKLSSARTGPCNLDFMSLSPKWLPLPIYLNNYYWLAQNKAIVIAPFSSLITPHNWRPWFFWNCHPHSAWTLLAVGWGNKMGI